MHDSDQSQASIQTVSQSECPRWWLASSCSCRSASVSHNHSVVNASKQNKHFSEHLKRTDAVKFKKTLFLLKYIQWIIDKNGCGKQQREIVQSWHGVSSSSHTLWWEDHSRYYSDKSLISNVDCSEQNGTEDSCLTVQMVNSTLRASWRSTQNVFPRAMQQSSVTMCSGDWAESVELLTLFFAGLLTRIKMDPLISKSFSSLLMWQAMVVLKKNSTGPSGELLQEFLLNIQSEIWHC